MQQDRRHFSHRADRRAARERQTHYAHHLHHLHHTLAATRRGRHNPTPPPRDIRGTQRKPESGAGVVLTHASTTSAASVCGASLARGSRIASRRSGMRGAALLDVMFAMAALMAGAQGFAHWQAAGGMTSAELASLPAIATMTSAAPKASTTPLPIDRWR